MKSCPGGEFPVGAKVAALMGGLGRTINGSYAEYTRAPASNVAPIESDLPWAELAAIPETYATAWTCLFRSLEIAKGQALVIRGATSSFGRAATNMAVNAGAHVIATTRNEKRFGTLRDLGAARVEIEGPDLSKRIAEAKQLDALLDLVGNSTILDRWRAAFILPSLAASCSARRASRYRTCRCKRSRTRWPNAASRRSLRASSASRRSRGPPRHVAQ